MTDNINFMVAFVILHYQNVEVTHEAVDFLRKLDGIDQHEIVIVDNLSPNGTGSELKKKYEEISNIHVLLSKKNLGFASGNNLGYRYAKKQLAVDIVVAMNSDVYIEDQCFLSKLIATAHNYSQYSIISPDIILKNGFHQNPFMLKPIPTQKQKQILIKKKIGLFLYSLPCIGSMLLKRKSVREFQPNRQYKESKKIDNIVPHGACLIFLSSWVHNEPRAFVEGTFLFVEEELLYDYCRANGHLILYYPELIVYHAEDASQDKVYKTALGKKLNQIKYEIDSRSLLLKKRGTYFKEG